jgi:quinol monooxygenase YgiN
MTTISKGDNFLTLINVFTVEPKNQQRLVALLKLATESTVRNITGFISSSLHRSLDGTKVTMYAQWRSMEDYQNMRNNVTASPYLEEALEFAKFDPGMYEVVETFLPVEP